MKSYRAMESDGELMQTPGVGLDMFNPNSYGLIKMPLQRLRGKVATSGLGKFLN